MEIFSKIISLEKPTGTAMRQRLIELLCEIGESSGYTVIAGQDVDCEWIGKDERVAMEVQFGNPGEYYQSLRKLALCGAKYCILIMSSKAQSLDLPQTIKLMQDTFTLGQKEFLVLDIETGKHFIRSAPAQKQQPKKPRSQQQFQQQQRPQQQRSQQQSGNQNRRPQSKPRRPQRRKMIYGIPGEHKEQD